MSRKSNLKKIFAVTAISLFANSAFAFDWPIGTISNPEDTTPLSIQEQLGNDYCKSEFGQNRTGHISTSLIFNVPESVKVSEDGRILAVITEYKDDNDFFPSTLGTAVIIAHEDNLVSVYGNIDTESLYISSENNYKVEEGTILGECGNTGWQEEKSTLEFQILDVKNSSAINPKLLLSRMESELPLTLTEITFKNKNNDYFSLHDVRTYQSGLYKIYRKRNPIAAPYKTNILINGIQYDEIVYDTIVEENNRICVNGKRKYTREDVYPNNNLQLVGEVMLSPGKSRIDITVTDFLNKQKQISYNISVY